MMINTKSQTPGMPKMANTLPEATDPDSTSTTDFWFVELRDNTSLPWQHPLSSTLNGSLTQGSQWVKVINVKPQPQPQRMEGSTNPPSLLVTH